MTVSLLLQQFLVLLSQSIKLALLNNPLRNVLIFRMCNKFLNRRACIELLGEEQEIKEGEIIFLSSLISFFPVHMEEDATSRCIDFSPPSFYMTKFGEKFQI